MTPVPFFVPTRQRGREKGVYRVVLVLGDEAGFRVKQRPRALLGLAFKISY